jgi:hypothetical protein
MKLALHTRPIVWETTASQRIFRTAKEWGAPELYVRLLATGSLPVYRVWMPPDGFELTFWERAFGESFERRRHQLYVAMPGVAGYPYEGGLPHAEYPDDECLLVQTRAFNDLFVPFEPTSTTRMRFAPELYGPHGTPLTAADIQAFEARIVALSHPVLNSHLAASARLLQLAPVA